MKHRYYPILLLYFFQAACMPEEDLPIRHTGETPCRQSHFTDTCFIHSPRFRVYIQLWKPGKI